MRFVDRGGGVVGEGVGGGGSGREVEGRGSGGEAGGWWRGGCCCHFFVTSGSPSLSFLCEGWRCCAAVAASARSVVGK